MSIDKSKDRCATMKCPLDTLRRGQSGRVEEIACSCGELRRKLFSFGLVSGAEVTVSKVAPLGCPITVTVCGSEVALRRSEAAPITVLPHQDEIF